MHLSEPHLSHYSLSNPGLVKMGNSSVKINNSLHSLDSFIQKMSNNTMFKAIYGLRKRARRQSWKWTNSLAQMLPPSKFFTFLFRFKDIDNYLLMTLHRILASRNGLEYKTTNSNLHSALTQVFHNYLSSTKPQSLLQWVEEFFSRLSGFQ